MSFVFMGSNKYWTYTWILEPPTHWARYGTVLLVWNHFRCDSVNSGACVSLYAVTFHFNLSLDWTLGPGNTKWLDPKWHAPCFLVFHWTLNRKESQYIAVMNLTLVGCPPIVCVSGRRQREKERANLLCDHWFCWRYESVLFCWGFFLSSFYCDNLKIEW